MRSQSASVLIVNELLKAFGGLTITGDHYTSRVSLFLYFVSESRNLFHLDVERQWFPKYCIK